MLSRMGFVIDTRTKTFHVIWIVFVINIRTKVITGAKIRNRYNQVPHLTQDTNGKVTNLQ